MLTEYVATYLQAEGLGTKGEDLFVATRPDDPDNCIILYDEPGEPEPYMQDYASDSMGLQVMVRGSYSYAKAKIWAIHKKILGHGEVDASDYYLKIIRTQTPPGQLENDEEGRKLWTAHYVALTNSYNDSNRQPITQP